MNFNNIKRNIVASQINIPKTNYVSFFLKQSLLFFLFSILYLTAAYAQSSLRGKVIDNQGEPIVDAIIQIPQLKLYALSNENGYYSIAKIPPGSYQILGTYSGMDTLQQTVTLQPDRVLVLDITLKEKAVQLKEVEIIAEKFGRIEKTKANTGIVKITTQEIKMLPSLGTPDLSQYLQVIPGVVFTGDQGGQLFIRGGTPIQNLTLLDGAIVYNPFHTLGLFSIFDTDILRSVDVYSGGFSAEYGGRLSSVLDVKTRNGNFERFSGKVHLNPITAGALLEGPLFKTKDKSGASFLLSVRNCFLDQTSKVLYSYVNDQKVNGEPLGLPFSFTDIYGKITLGAGSNQLNLFGFHQSDAVNYQYPSNYNWKSTGGGANFYFLPPNSSVIISGNVAASSYTSKQLSDTEKYPRSSTVGGFNSRLNFTYILNSIDELAYGIQILGFNTNLRFSNSLGLQTSQENFNTEMSAYIKYRKVFKAKKQSILDDEKKIKERVVLEPSLRFHYFNEFSKIMAEPRFRAKINFRKFSFQMATGLYSQNLVSATSDRDIVVLFQGFLSAPEDFAGKKFDHPLQTAYHVLGGFQFELIPNLEANIEGWYKNFTQLTNINRSRLFPEDPTFIGETGDAYGVDFSFKYQKNGLYLYATYGWAKVTRNDQQITYHPVFDRRHTVNLVGSYKTGEVKNKNGKIISPKWEFSTRWTFGSGFPFTQTQGLFEKLDFYSNGSKSDLIMQNGQLNVLLSYDYNGSRLPSYHRLDFSAKYYLNIGRNGLLEFNVNAINVYSRPNIFYFDRLRFKRVDQLPFVPTVGAAYSF